MTAAIIISLMALALTVLGLVVKVTTFTTKIDVWVSEMRKERKVIVRIPLLEMRIGYLERHLDIKSGMPSPHTSAGEDDFESHES